MKNTQPNKTKVLHQGVFSMGKIQTQISRPVLPETENNLNVTKLPFLIRKADFLSGKETFLIRKATTLRRKDIFLVRKTEMFTRKIVFLSRKQASLKVKNVFFQEKQHHLQEKEFFLQERRMRFQEKKSFLQEKSVRLQENTFFFQEITKAKPLGYKRRILPGIKDKLLSFVFKKAFYKNASQFIHPLKKKGGKKAVTGFTPV
jgi:GTPase Era involved in 16S rRNA processing